MKSYEDLVEENKALSRAVGDLGLALMYANEVTMEQEERNHADPIELLGDKPYQYKCTFVNGLGEPIAKDAGSSSILPDEEYRESAVADGAGIIGHHIYAGYDNRYVGFVPKGKSATLSDGKLIVHDADRAQVGDTIRDYQGREVVVTEVGEDGTACGSTSATTGSCSPLGRYTVLKRATHKKRAKVGDLVTIDVDAVDDNHDAIFGLVFPGILYPVKRVTDDAVWIDTQKDETTPVPHKWMKVLPTVNMPEPTTADLVEMLAKREGVTEVVVNPYDELAYFRSSNKACEDPRTVHGPARVLVVID